MSVQYKTGGMSAGNCAKSSAAAGVVWLAAHVDARTCHYGITLSLIVTSLTTRMR